MELSMLTQVRVERFKSIVALDLELGRVNLFIGANGSGKSNLLEALGVLGAAAFGRVDDETLLRRGVRPGVPRLYKSAFPTTKQKTVQNILFEAVSSSGASYRVTLWNPIEKPTPAWGFMTERLCRSTPDVVETRTTTSAGKHNREQGMAALRTASLKPGDAALGLMDELRNYSIFCPNTPSLRGLVQDLQAREPIGLAGGRLPEGVDELLEAARKDSKLNAQLSSVRDLIDWSKSFSAAPSIGVPLSPSAARSRMVIQFADRFMAKGRNTLTGYDASEGALYVLFCAVLALHPRAPSCLAVDNVDQALNPKLAARLITNLCEWTNGALAPKQWLITAHNAAVLDGLPIDDPSVRLFAVDRDSQGHTQVNRIDLTDALSRRPNADWTLSRMWMNGYLGAVPNV
jgi:energy-coupling factor transporter ATP-binding protein EcfA2